MSTERGPTAESLLQATVQRRKLAIGDIIEDLLDAHEAAPRDFDTFVAIKNLALARCRQSGHHIEHADIVRAIWARLEARDWHLDE
jgi:hypothetical protein